MKYYYTDYRDYRGIQFGDQSEYLEVVNHNGQIIKTFFRSNFQITWTETNKWNGREISTTNATGLVQELNKKEYLMKLLE